MKGATKRKHRQGGPRGGFLRRSPFLVSYWQGKRLCFENYLTRKKIAASIETAAMLDFFSSWKREEAMFRRWPEYTAQSLRLAVARTCRVAYLSRRMQLLLRGGCNGRTTKSETVQSGF